MSGAARRWVGMAVTALLVVGAVIGCIAVWHGYMTATWTRDGQVQAYVVGIAPEVSGRIVSLHVADNQTVKRDDILYEIDPVDYEIALASAEAGQQSRQADLTSKRNELERRQQLSTLSTSVEELQTYQASYDMAVAAFASAVTQSNQARIDLARTKVKSPVNGVVTNLLVQQGDYATKGTRNIAVVNTDSFWIAAFFEETKIGGIKPGDPAVAALLGYAEPVRGRVDSIATGITTPNTAPGTLGLASVNPVFTWVRLAQRIPVRIRIEEVPASVRLAVGMTATVTVGADAGAGSPRGVVSRWLTLGPR